MRTGGYIPSWPLNQNIYPGDFFQIRNGEMIPLGNIFRKGIVDPADCPLEYRIGLNPASWNFSDGVSKPYSGRGTGTSPIEGHFEYSKQVLAFERSGSFFFKAHQPELVRMSKWNDFIQRQLIIKMTQAIYSFRELYLVTECVSAADWTLAIAGSGKAELEIATDSENFGLVDIFGHQSSRTIQSKDIEYYHRETRKKPSFFAAKKLVVQDEKMGVFTNELIRQRQDLNNWASNFFEEEFYYDPVYSSPVPGNAQASVIDMLSANELNPNTALLYFKWADASLDDIEKFFVTYGK
jgi:hypothetical protein